MSEARASGPALCVVLEGWDAEARQRDPPARRSRSDPRTRASRQVRHPHPDEAASPILTGFAPALPGPRGHAVSTGVSMAGARRRVEAAQRERVGRAYQSITAFEHELAWAGTVRQAWLHISAEEQAA